MYAHCMPRVALYVRLIHDDQLGQMSHSDYLSNASPGVPGGSPTIKEPNQDASLISLIPLVDLMCQRSQAFLDLNLEIGGFLR